MPHRERGQGPIQEELLANNNNRRGHPPAANNTSPRKSVNSVHPCVKYTLLVFLLAVFCLLRKTYQLLVGGAADPESTELTTGVGGQHEKALRPLAFLMRKEEP